MTISSSQRSPNSPGDVDAWLVRKSHAGFENGLAAADEIRMLVAVESDTMTEAVREELVVGTVAAIGR